MGLLPKDYESIPLDMFCHWQWQPSGENTKTFLDLPKKMSYGRWLSPAIEPVGQWTEKRVANPDNSKPVALWYVDEAGNVHPFKRNGWFMNSNFAKQQNLGLPDEPGAGDATGDAGDWAKPSGSEDTTANAANTASPNKEEDLKAGSWDELGGENKAQ